MAAASPPGALGVVKGMRCVSAGDEGGVGEMGWLGDGAGGIARRGSRGAVCAGTGGGDLSGRAGVAAVCGVDEAAGAGGGLTAGSG